ncbi:MAG: type III-B CRISPR module-associated Cmr3 family protein [Myxococcales bacterium]|nr:type III-B CRISPR module-associated protein Cmr3 [Myxococcota bacterium]MDW8283215.1 type III-B CRISPR module-associated Cmr3 family protein [Myxococcales bacterium]
MSTVTFWVRPAEALYFGPPRSFFAGEAHHSSSLFPPPPMAFQGMVRTRLLRAVEPPLDLADRSPEARARIANLVGEPDKLPPGWQLEGPLPVVLDHEGALVPWLPAPAFLLGHHNPEPVCEEPVAALEEPLAFDDAAPEGRKVWIGAPQAEHSEPLGGWVSAGNLRWALSKQGRWDPNGFHPALPPFVRYEIRPGLVVMRQSGTAKDQMLYFLRMLHFRPDSGLLGRLTVDGECRVPLNALTHGAGAAGRKGRLVTYHPAPRLHDDWVALRQGSHLPEKVEDGAGCWIVSLGPCEPEAEPLLREQAPGFTLRVLARRLAPPVTLGGLRVDGTQRPARTYAGGGSAFFVEIQGGTPEARAELLKRLHGACVLAQGAARAFGFGQVLCGVPLPLFRSPSHA